MQQPTADQPPNTVLQVLEQGFQIHDQVLRPARVIVSVPVP
jgi:molecular chaperone GrpE